MVVGKPPLRAIGPAFPIKTMQGCIKVSNGLIDVTGTAVRDRRQSTLRALRGGSNVLSAGCLQPCYRLGRGNAAH